MYRQEGLLEEEKPVFAQAKPGYQISPEQLASLPVSGSLDLSQIKLTEKLIETLITAEVHKSTLAHHERETHKAYMYGVHGLYVGLGVVLAGTLLCWLGVSGAVDFQIRLDGFTQKISNAAPGVVLMFIGMLIVYFTRPRLLAANISDGGKKPLRSIGGRKGTKKEGEVQSEGGQDTHG